MRAITGCVALLALVWAAAGCDLNREDGTWTIALRNDTTTAVVVRDCRTSACDRFRYVKYLPPGVSVTAHDYGDGTSWWLVTNGNGDRLGCLTLGIGDRVGGNTLKVSSLTDCPVL